MRFKNVLFRFATFFLLAALVVAHPAGAQEARGTIWGRVMDATGAVIPGAIVEVLNKAMGTRVALITNEAGVYQAAYLIPAAIRSRWKRRASKSSSAMESRSG